MNVYKMIRQNSHKIFLFVANWKNDSPKSLVTSMLNKQQSKNYFIWSKSSQLQCTPPSFNKLWQNWMGKWGSHGKVLKNSVKDKIVKINQFKKLDKMIEKSVIINNRQYKYQLKRENKPSQWSFADQDNRPWEKHHKSHQSKKYRY